MLNKGDYVKHKLEGYEGFIDDVTRMKELFSGNKDVDCQYRIQIKGNEIRRIAPEEDLEVIKTENYLMETNDSKFGEVSFLRDAGYSLQLNLNSRRLILKEVVKQQGLYKVVSIIMRSFMYNRTNPDPKIDSDSKENGSILLKFSKAESDRGSINYRTSKFIRALNEWASDVDWLIENFKNTEDFNEAYNLYNEFKMVLYQRGYSWVSRNL